ncbi:unnamed protein product [Sphagnum balticum]
MHFFSTPFISELVQITHVMHLAAQAAVRYAMENPGSYVRSNIAQLVNSYIDDIVKTGCVASLDVVDKRTSSGGKKTGHVWFSIFNLGMLVLQTLLPTLIDILEKYFNLKSKREIVKMPCDGDVPFANVNISAAQA